MTKFRAGLAALLLALVSLWLVALPAKADTDAPITAYHAAVKLTPEGVAQMKIDFTMDFSVVRGRGPIVVLPTAQDDGENPEEQYVFRYSNLKVTSSSGARTGVEKKVDSEGMALRIGDPNVYHKGPQDYTLTYDVTGFIVSNHKTSGLDEFNWNAIGPAWESRLSNISVEVSGPADVQGTACFYGRGYSTPCEGSQSGASARFSVGALSPGEPMQVVAGFPAGTFGGVEQEKRKRPSFANAFSVTPLTGGVAGAGLLAAIGGLAAIRRRYAGDDVFVGLTPGLTPAKGEAGKIGKAPKNTPVTVQFNPPKGSTPGEIGTLMDTTADNIDVSATLVHLAVRGHLQIKSKGGDKFVLHATNPPQPDPLEAFEARLLADVFQGKRKVSSSDLSEASHQSDLATARSGLYHSVLAKGWFNANPVAAQTLPIVIGVGSFIAAGVVAIGLFMSGWSLVSIPLAVFGIGLVAMSGKFRKRTAVGSANLAQAKGFELYLRTAEKDTLRFEEGQDIFSRYLPYAMVFGVADRWSNLFAQLGAEGRYHADTSWYSGADLYNGFAFASAMNSLTSTMSTSLNAAHAAGMAESTGGSSGSSGFDGGGGFGGGGGGSW